MKKIFTLISCAAVLSLCLCACAGDGPQRTAEPSAVSASSSDISFVSETEIDYSGYVVPAEDGLEYAPWAVCEGSYAQFAQAKLLDMAGKVSSLCSYEVSLKEYGDPNAMLGDAGFHRLLNDLRAWSFGAASYPNDALKNDEEKEICRRLSVLGSDCVDFAEHLPSFVLCGNEASIAECENNVLSQIAQLNAILDAGK